MLALPLTLFRELFENLDIGVVLLDSERRIRAANSAYSRITGVAEAALLARDCFYVHHCVEYNVDSEHSRGVDLCRQNCPFRSPGKPPGSRLIWLQAAGRSDIPCVQSYSVLSEDGAGEGGLLMFLTPLGNLNEVVVDARRMRHEMCLAAEAQETLVPVRLGAPAGMEVAAYSRPFRPIGGDLFDSWVTLDGSEAYLYAADISGKSLPAALYSQGLRQRARHCLRTELLSSVRALNEDLAQWLPDSMFVAATFVRCGADPGGCELLNAGGPEPWIYLQANGRAQPLESCLGMALAVMPESIYSSLTVHLDPGDLLLLWTDGVTEALELNGRSQRAFVEQLAMAPAGELRSCLDDLLQGLRSQDDATALALRRRQRSETVS